MNLKKFYEKNMHTALQKIREELGENAVIISSNQSATGVEVVAATDYEAVANGDMVTSTEKYINPNIDHEDNTLETPEHIGSKRIDPIVHEIDTTAIQDEISQLRKIIESQTEMISWNKLFGQNSIARQHLQKLSISGFGFNLSKVLLDDVINLQDFDKA